MKIIDFNTLAEKKKACDQVRQFLTEGKAPIDIYIDALESALNISKEALQTAQDFINELKAQIADQEELIQAQEKLISLLQGDTK